MRLRSLLITAFFVLVATWGCSGARQGRDAGDQRGVVAVTAETLPQNVGHRISVQGTFSMRGVQGPFIAFDGQAVYLVSRGTFTWSEAYERLEGKTVRATGTLRFMRFKPSDAQHPPDYFYMDAGDAVVEPVSR